MKHTAFYWKLFSQTLKYSEERGKSEIGGIHHWLWGMDASELRYLYLQLVNCNILLLKFQNAS